MQFNKQPLLSERKLLFISQIIVKLAVRGVESRRRRRRRKELDLMVEHAFDSLLAFHFICCRNCEYLHPYFGLHSKVEVTAEFLQFRLEIIYIDPAAAAAAPLPMELLF